MALMALGEDTALVVRKGDTLRAGTGTVGSLVDGGAQGTGGTRHGAR